VSEETLDRKEVPTMPALPWQSVNPPDPEREYVALASFLPLKRFAATIRFFRSVRAVQGQLASARGLVGYSLLAKPLARNYWTLSLWEDDAAPKEFVQAEPHVRVMRDIRPDLGDTKFTQVRVRGSAAPLAWNWALELLRSDRSL
jgi:heme-degrading monooxygenase HmoA